MPTPCTAPSPDRRGPNPSALDSTRLARLQEVLPALLLAEAHAARLAGNYAGVAVLQRTLVQLQSVLVRPHGAVAARAMSRPRGSAEGHPAPELRTAHGLVGAAIALVSQVDVLYTDDVDRHVEVALERLSDAIAALGEAETAASAGAPLPPDPEAVAETARAEEARRSLAAPPPSPVRVRRDLAWGSRAPECTATCPRCGGGMPEGRTACSPACGAALYRERMALDEGEEQAPSETKTCRTCEATYPVAELFRGACRGCREAGRLRRENARAAALAAYRPDPSQEDVATALREARGEHRLAAKALGIGRNRLWRLRQQHGLATRAALALAPLPELDDDGGAA
jgi:hypothetical protein